MAADDDAERLVEADALLVRGDPRGELIVVQCELARGGFDRARGQKLRKREQELLRHAAEWLAPLRAIVTNPIIRRGFVDEVTIDATTYITREPELWALAPRLRWIRMTGLSCTSNIQDLAYAGLEFHQISPFLDAAFANGRIQWFEPVDAEVTYPYMGEMSIYERSHSFADDIALWLREHDFARMRGVRFTMATDSTLASLGRSEGNLEEVSVAGYEYLGARSLEQTKLRPRRLGLLGSADAAPLMQTPLFENVVDLELGRIQQRRVTVPPTVRRLRAKCQYPQYELADILASPGLSTVEELVIRGEPVGVSHQRAEVDLAKVAERAGLDALRVLRLEFMKATNLDAFLASPLAQRLELLDIDGDLFFP